MGCRDVSLLDEAGSPDRPQALAGGDESDPEAAESEVAMARGYPWRLGTFRLAPAGLREAVLRVQWMKPYELQRIIATPSDTGTHWHKTPMLVTVARWRLGQGCTPEQWHTLVAAIGTCRKGPERALD